MALPIIKLGSQGSAVKLCQERLIRWGYVVKPDKDFGPKTDNAVEQFQAAHALKPDGIVGPQTWNALMVETMAPEPVDLMQEQRDWLVSQIPSTTPPIVKRVLTLACQDLGKREDPDGSNDGPEIHSLVKGYNQYWWVFPNDSTREQKLQAAKARGYPLESEVVAPMAWCGMCISNWIRQGLDLPYWDYKAGYATPLTGHPFKKFFGGPGPVEDWARSLSRWETDTSKTLPAGACFTISRSQSGSDPSSSPKAGHIGMVLCDLGDGTIRTIEGNVSNKVDSYTRKKADLRGWCTWW